MAIQHFTEEPRYVALMPAVHASLELYSSDPYALVLAHVLEQLLAILEGEQ